MFAGLGMMALGALQAIGQENKRAKQDRLNAENENNRIARLNKINPEVIRAMGILPNRSNAWMDLLKESTGSKEQTYNPADAMYAGTSGFLKSAGMGQDIENGLAQRDMMKNIGGQNQDSFTPPTGPTSNWTINSDNQQMYQPDFGSLWSVMGK
jgi:hypothetical protein